ncbi:MAG: hypothetical protein ACRDTU_19030 [Micromonosporaceae bacterium]
MCVGGVARSRRQVCGLLAVLLCLLIAPYGHGAGQPDSDTPDRDQGGVALSHQALAPQSAAAPGRCDLRGVAKRVAPTAPALPAAHLAAAALRAATGRWGVVQRTVGGRSSVAAGEVFRGRAPPVVT